MYTTASQQFIHTLHVFQIPIVVLHEGISHSDPRIKLVDVASSAAEYFVRPEDFEGFSPEDYRTKAVVILWDKRNDLYIPTCELVPGGRNVAKVHLKQALQHLTMALTEMDEANLAKLDQADARVAATLKAKLANLGSSFAKLLQRKDVASFFEPHTVAGEEEAIDNEAWVKVRSTFIMNF